MSQGDADTVIMLSSELIAEVMESYLNKQMFKRKVTVVDLRPTETGYAFSLAFVSSASGTANNKQPVIATATVQNGTAPLVDVRDNKGRFVRHK